MKKVGRCFIGILFVILIFSFCKCEREDVVKFRSRYLFTSYYVPEKALVAIGHNYESFTISLSSSQFIEISNPSAFIPISKEFETGEKELFLSAPPLRKPYNILALKVFQSTSGSRTDITKECSIAFLDYSYYIQRGYEGVPQFIEKGVLELDKHDMLWLPERIELSHKLESCRGLSLEIALKERPPLIIELTRP